MPSKVEKEPGPKRPQSAKMSSVVSYEDMIIAQYLDELKKSPPYTKKSHHAPPSPYRQTFEQTSRTVPYGSGRGKRQRPHSAMTPSTLTGNKPRIDPKFIADRDKWDPATPRADEEGTHTEQTKNSRPVSAPAGNNPNRRRPLSVYYTGSRMRPQSAKSGVSATSSIRSRKIRSLYRKQPQTIVVTAFKNGSQDGCCKVAASTLKLLLEICTDKLGLSMAARRVFLSDGKEVTDPREIPRGADIYVSMGEDFKDPLRNAAQEANITKSATWTMNGLIIPHTKKRKAKPFMTKRFKSLIERSTIRILVFKNGHHTDGIEMVADPRHWQMFLDGLSSKLDLRSPARILYDWEGNAVIQVMQSWDGRDRIEVKEIPKLLDPCMQTTATSQVLGPLWASANEGFSPVAATNYLKSISRQVKTRIEESNRYKEQLNLAKDGEVEHIQNLTVSSMTEPELDNALAVVDCDLRDYNAMRQKLKQYIDDLRPELANEMDEGNAYKLKHIQALETQNKLVDIRGIRLMVYKNGSNENPVSVFFNITDARRGIGEDKQKLMEKLLDHLANSCKHFREDGEQGGMVSRKWKIFDKSGREITDIHTLESDQEVWLSFGDQYKCPFTFCLQATFDRVRGYTLITAMKAGGVEASLMNNLVMAGEEENGDLPADADNGAVTMEERQVLIREQLMADPDVMDGKDKPGCWQTVMTPPDSFYYERVDPSNQDLIEHNMSTSEISANTTFLVSKDDSSLVLFPELGVATKKPRGHNSVWPPDSQLWVITKDGFIYLKSIPSLVLSVSEAIIKMELPNGTTAEGYAVTLQKKQGTDTMAQKWSFGMDGYITAESQPELALTYLGGVMDNEETIQSCDDPSIPSGLRFFAAVCERLPKKDGKFQRWAIKQERMDKPGQWKHSVVDNPEWNKRALSWPVDKDGEINEKFEWPMEGYIIPYAPPLASPRRPSQTMTAMRLMVLRNGEKDEHTATPIVGPDLTNMMKDLNRPNKNGKTSKSKRPPRGDPDKQEDSVADVKNLHCSDMSLQQLEFLLFLEHCTTLLNLSFAARRLFDAQGHEHFTLQDLKRDQIVFVSCGEPWTDPKLTKAEQQRRFLLANLSADIAQIRQFVALRKPEGYVLEVEGGLTTNARLIINKSSMSADEDEAENAEGETEHPAAEEQEEENEQLVENIDVNMSAHERSHMKSEQRLENLKWPWERIIAQDDEDEVDSEEKKKEEAFTNKDLYRKYKPKEPMSPRFPRLYLQKFTYCDGFLACSFKPDLVLGITEAEGRVSEVVLVKKRIDDIYQRWVTTSSGLIKAKYNQKMVLSVTMPTNMRREDESMPLSYDNSTVVMLQHKNTQFGRANQKFMFDHETGLIHAFYTDFLDQEITAANKANICTFAVIGDAELDQPGYQVDYPMPNNTVEKLIVCASCARAMRGRYKTQKITKNVDFACAMGRAQELGIRQVGSFQCLNGKVDLSTFEASHTLQEWEDQLQRFRLQRSVRAIAREISQAKCPQTIKVAAYKNGKGRTEPPELVYASSIPGLLQQCTERLGVNQAVRRMYTSDGMIALDMEDLIQWAINHYIIQLKREKLTEEEVVDENGNEGGQEEGDDQEGINNSQASSCQGTNSSTSGPVEVRILMPGFSAQQGHGGDEPAEPDEGKEVEDAGDSPDKAALQTEDMGTELHLQAQALELSQLEHVKIEIPSVEKILQQPVELWASFGEAFKPPKAVNERIQRKKKWQEQRSAVVQELELEKHVLRQIQGRRLNEGNPGSFKPTNDPDQPVVIEGTWQEPTDEEQQKHDAVHQLKNHLTEVKATQDSDSLKTCNAATSHRLYGQPQMRRVQVYPNGESVSRAVYVWGESVEQILENATMRLNLRKRGKHLYDVSGKLISTFHDVERDMLLCVSGGKPFLKPKDLREDIEIKANWSRARKKYGPRATDIEVFTNKNPRVDVDPFGPPALAENTSKKPPRPRSAKRNTPPTDDDTEFIDEMRDQQENES